MLGAFRGVCIVNRWGKGGPYKSMGGCDTVPRYAQLANEEVCMSTALLVRLEEGDAKKRGMTEVFVYFEAFRLFGCRRKDAPSRRCVLLFEGGDVCHFTVWVALL